MDNDGIMEGIGSAVLKQACNAVEAGEMVINECTLLFLFTKAPVKNPRSQPLSDVRSILRYLSQPVPRPATKTFS